MIVDLIFVPQGAEYQAVCLGLKQVPLPHPLVVPIPVGPQPVTRYLTELKQTKGLLNQSQTKVLVMGLCGSLSPNYGVGDVVLYRDCLFRGNRKECDRDLTNFLGQKLHHQVDFVSALTSDRIIYSQEQKCQLGEEYPTQVVDMEGFAVLEVLQDTGIILSILRVVSDGYEDNLPDLNSALNVEGVLEPFPLAIELIRHPFTGVKLILNSLKSLKTLQQITVDLFTD